jgi:hypothetical protein
MLAGRDGLSPVTVRRASELARLRRLLDACQREVAALLAEGWRNDEIARRLLIAATLGMISRAGVAAWAARSDLGAPAPASAQAPGA